MPGDKQSDEDLMLLVGQGDREACRILVTRHLGRIQGFATRVMGNASEGEDIAQDVFLRLWKHASGWQPTGAKLSTWLHRIALNLCLNKKKRRREILRDTPIEVEDPRSEPATIAHQREMENHVNAALATLPTNQRAAITMCHYQGMRNAEAAEILDVSIEALESLLARGRRNMRSQLAELAGELLEGGIS